MISPNKKREEPAAEQNEEAVAKEWVDELIRKQIVLFEVEEMKGEEKIEVVLEPKVQAADGKFSEQTLYCLEPECDSPF